MKLRSLHPKFKISLLLIILQLAILPAAFGQKKTEKLDELINKYTEYGQFNGSVLIAEKGKVIYKKGFGLANMEWDIPNQPNTKHRLGSITKQFTSMLIMQLVAQGKLDLNVPISTYLPDYSKINGDKFTLHHLLSHTAGIPNYTSYPNFFKDMSRDPYSPMEFLQFFADSTLRFTPGEKFEYSNSGYFLLGVIIEKVTDKSYEQVLQENIFTPLGMNDTGFDLPSPILKNRAAGYEKNGSSYRNADYLDMSIPYAAGSMYSTVEDLYKWDQALYSEKLLSKKYLDMMFERHIPTGNSHYAYGWGIGKMAIGTSADSVNTIGHGGGINGFNTLITRVPSDKTLIVLLNNTGGAPLNGLTKAIAGILYNKPYAMPKQSLATSVLNVINDKGLEEGLAHYKKYKADSNYELQENEINWAGYQLLGSDKIKEAVAVFKLNVDEFPKSSNVYDSYGEALKADDQTELAIVNYKKSVEINPANTGGIKILKEMGVEVEEASYVVDEKILASYVGTYELVPGFSIEITKEGNRLFAQATGQGKNEVFAKNDTEFYLKVVVAQIVFKKGSDGKIETMTLFQNGQEMPGKRIEK
jgi:CubicO group peptidase (beta-lactamase class C family)